MRDDVARRFREIVPAVDFCTIRVVEERDEQISVRRGVLQPVTTSLDAGAMITVVDRGGMGYAATPDLTTSGLRLAAERAREWAHRASGRMVLDPMRIIGPTASGEYTAPVRVAWDGVPLSRKIDLLRVQCERLKTDDRIRDWEAGLWFSESDVLLLSADGACSRQRFAYLLPSLSASANDGPETQTRTFGGHSYCRQGGFEVIEESGFESAAPAIAAEALALVYAPDCPSGPRALLLAPDQMILQIHESIGHPLELDRILGDERNYAGRSFVTLDMFGSYRYGSSLLNVVFDPTRQGELASYAFDDEGQPARREVIIREGILERPLGGLTSQVRAGISGVANARASSWNRPPIDRMANLNLEPGTTSFDDMVAGTERGIYMKTNSSWSIDDSRNKFQFGCEWARLIEDGRLTTLVKNPNYRGVSASFWRSLAAVGNEATLEVLGTPYCGKGEPNQGIRVGHASPACLFLDADVFGGV